ncbi:MAG: DnaJ domain-containing protein [Proteobacteria bacterium]|nr:DnaJ domain-containing protein [Pseudomonadota bacterium]
MFVFYLLVGVGLLLVVWLVLRGFAQADPKQLAKAFKWLAGGAIVLVAAWLVLSGRLGQALMVGSALVPLFLRWKSLFAMARNATGPQRGQSSDVETAYLRMSLDHDTGAMDGTVLRGRFGGRRLGELTPADCLDLLAECRVHDPEAATLLEAYLDRAQPDWRAQAGAGAGDTQPGDGGQTASGSPSAAMTREEAYRILGLEPGASDAAIRDAHRHLMLKLHPDQGGPTYLAAKINQAKDLLLGK